MLYITMISRASIVVTLVVIMPLIGPLMSMLLATAFRVISNLVTIPSSLSPSITIARSVFFSPSFTAVWQMEVSFSTFASSWEQTVSISLLAAPFSFESSSSAYLWDEDWRTHSLALKYCPTDLFFSIKKCYTFLGNR